MTTTMHRAPPCKKSSYAWIGWDALPQTEDALLRSCCAAFIRLSVNHPWPSPDRVQVSTSMTFFLDRILACLRLNILWVTFWWVGLCDTRGLNWFQRRSLQAWGLNRFHTRGLTWFKRRVLNRFQGCATRGLQGCVSLNFKLGTARKGSAGVWHERTDEKS